MAKDTLQNLLSQWALALLIGTKQHWSQQFMLTKGSAHDNADMFWALTN